MLTPNTEESPPPKLLHLLPIVNMKHLLLTHILFNYFGYFVIGNTNPVVQLTNGKIFGKQTTNIHNKSYYSFERIPYAAPPVGKLRFQSPQWPENWDHILNCTHLDTVCYQLSPSNMKESEDCLFLNVFTPQLPSQDRNSSFPVMFYIHGGGFHDGSSRVYRPDLLIDKDVILVTINYRLGPFGFLSTQDGTVPGNNGLKDQNLALRWVQANIRSFGGDPRRVTIFGHSAGSASVGYHLLNPESEGLFWAAICQSGSLLSTWAHQQAPRKAALKLASLLNETFKGGSSSDDLLEFLQSVGADDIQRAARLYKRYVYNGRNGDIASLKGADWAPTLEANSDGSFVNRKMFGALEAGQVIRVPLLIGFVTEENLIFHTDSNKMKETMKLYDDDVTYLVPVNMEITNMSQRLEIGNLIKNMYTSGDPFVDNLGAGLRFSSDNGITRPIMKQAELMSKFSETYFYVYSYEGMLGYQYDSYEGAGKVGHGDELSSLFCLEEHPHIKNLSKSDELMRRRMVKMWTDFAKFRNPTPGPSKLLQDVSWPVLSVDNGTFAYVDIGVDLKIRNYPKKETYKKWNELYNSLGQKDFTTW